MPLPFPRLPLLIQTEVLGHLKPIDIFIFSLLSSKSRDILQYCKGHIDCVTWQFNEIDYSIELSSTTSSESWILRIPSEYTGDTEDQFATLTFNGTHHPIYQTDPNHLQIAPGALTMCERIRLFEHLTKCVFDVFRIQDCHLKARILNRAEFVSRYTSKLKSLEILDTVTNSQFQRILENLKIEELRIQKAGARPRLKFTGHLKMRSLICDDLNWLAEQDIMKLDCDEVLINTDCLSVDKMKAAILKWASGNWKNLKSFQVLGDFVRSRVDLIFEGISPLVTEDEARQIAEENEQRAVILQASLFLLNHSFHFVPNVPKPN